MSKFYPRQNGYCECHQYEFDCDPKYGDSCPLCRKAYAHDTRKIPGLNEAVSEENCFLLWCDLQMGEKEYNNGLLTLDQAIEKRDAIIQEYNNAAIGQAKSHTEVNLEIKRLQGKTKSLRRIY